MKVILKIDGMSCSACQNRVEKYLNKQEGVKATVNLIMQEALIEFNEEKVSLNDLNRFIEESGYKSLGLSKEKQDIKKDYNKYYLLLFGFLLIGLMYISMSQMIKLPIIPLLHMKKHPVNYGVTLLLLTVPFIIFALDMIKSGLSKLFHKSPNMDSLVTIGILASLIYSTINLILIILGNNQLVENLYFESTSMIIYFIKVGRYISRNSKEKTKEAIKELVQITPQSALIKTKEEEKEITIDEIKKGDIIICKPGMKIAVDGIITKGETHLNESFITGESISSKKKKNDNVIAGSINIDGYIEYKAERIGPNSTISEIVKLVKEAINTKTPIEKLADKVSSYFVPIIIIISILTLLIYLITGKSLNESIISFITVLVISCPCALGLATPLAIVVSIGSCTKEGIFVKNSEILENAYKTDTIIFDKTGTLTYGNLKISKMINYSKYSDKELIKIAASLEKKSTHPIANAFKNYYEKNINVTNFENKEGIGVKGKINNKDIYIGNSKLFKNLNIKNIYQKEEAILSNEGNSIIYVIENKKVIGIIGVKDLIRKEAKTTVEQLKEMKKDIIILSGDNQKTANIIAKELEINKIIANVLPKEKEEVLKELIKNNHKIMMIGDGINDAPSLAMANIGVSLNSATDIAGDSSDIILTQDDLSKIVLLLEYSKKTSRIIKQNLFWALFYNTLMIPIAIGLLKPLGISISPSLASIAMTVSSITVILNSLRLKKI